MKKKLIVVAAVVVVLALAAVYFLWFPLSLSKVGDRNGIFTPGGELKSAIAGETSGMTAEEVRVYSIKKTAELLSFASKNDFEKGKANCVGYAKMCAGIADYAFKVNGLRCSAKPVVGYVMLYGINLCDVLKVCMPDKRWKNFVKDHDFVEFRIEGSIIYADPCMYDALLKDGRTIVE